MRYYSDLLTQFFDDEKDLKKAEREYQIEESKKKQELIKQEAEAKEQAALVSKEKRELSKAIEDAEAALSQAYADYESAKKEVKDLYNEYNQKALDILNPAKKVIEQAQKNRFNAISDFNKKYGVYTTTLSGTKAYQEFQRMSSWMDDIFNHLFW